MKYMALIFSNEKTDPAYGTPEGGKLIQDYMTVTAKFQEDGVMVSGDALEGVATATTVKVRDGKVETMDGPYAETKEQLGGYYVFDVESLDEALKYAAMIPSAKSGTIEVRPIMEFDE
ncbi:MAG: YciI family protein [Sneathiella sp.]